MTELIHKASGKRIADTYDFVVTDKTLDHHNEIVEVAGLGLENFKRNPVALYQHDHKNPVGVWANLRRVGDQLLATFVPVAEGTSRGADVVRSLLAQGVLKAASIGFRAIESEPLKPKGRIFTKAELLEVSLVSVGANPNALMIAKSLNMTEEEIQKYLPTVPAGINGEHGDALQLARRVEIQKRATETLFRAKTTIKNLR